MIPGDQSYSEALSVRLANNLAKHSLKEPTAKFCQQKMKAFFGKKIPRTRDERLVDDIAWQSLGDSMDQKQYAVWQ